MASKDGNTTNPLLLKKVTVWEDHSAWTEFFKCYDPLIRHWCRGYGLESSTLDDLCQYIWVELAGRMRTYQYDPGRTFRGWLRAFCHSRAVDLLRKRRGGSSKPIDGLVDLGHADPSAGHDDEGAPAPRVDLLHLSERAQRAVRQRVEPKTWMIFWRIAVAELPVREVADDLGMTYAAVFAAHKRVVGMLRAEGERRLAELSSRGAKAGVRETL
jgi:RNA polymerase sigma factor (sigma-70 family)